MSSASFVLMSSDLTSIITLIDLSQTVFRRVKFNFVCAIPQLWETHAKYVFQLWATIYNLVAVPIAAGVIYPAGHSRLDPVWGSLAMALS
jgi:Cu+-exporting ATPase